MTLKTRILLLESAIPGWMACYFAPAPENDPTAMPSLIGLPVVVWAVVSFHDSGKPDEESVTEIRAHVADLHGKVGDYLSATTNMTFLAMCPPGSDWMAISQRAFDDYQRSRLVETVEHTKKEDEPLAAPN